MRQNKKSIVALFFLAGAIALLVGVWLQQQRAAENTRYKEQLTATELTNPRPIPSFKLISETGKPFSNKDLRGHWSLVFFGFTNCPNICPVTMGQLKQLYQLLPQTNVKQPEMVFVSIDPERDTPQRVQEYVKTFNPNFHGATGDPKVIAKLTKALGIVNMKMAPNGQSTKQASYGISHSDAIVLINPNGQVQAFFSDPHKPQTMLKDYSAIVSHFKG